MKIVLAVLALFLAPIVSKAQTGMTCTTTHNGTLGDSTTNCTPAYTPYESGQNMGLLIATIRQRRQAKKEHAEAVKAAAAERARVDAKAEEAWEVAIGLDVIHCQNNPDAFIDISDAPIKHVPCAEEIARVKGYCLANDPDFNKLLFCKVPFKKP